KEFYLTFNSTLLKEAYSKFVDPKRGKLVIVGDFDSEEVKRYIKKHLSQWRGSQISPMEEGAPPPAQKLSKVVPKESFQTQILLGFRGPGLFSEKRVFLEVLNSALSGQDGPLFKILRDERSLAYAVTSFLLFYPKSSALIFYLACAPEKKEVAISGFYEVIEKIKKEKFSEKDLERAKNRLLGKYRMALQSNLAKAEDMAVNEVLGLGWDFTDKYQEQIQKISTRDLIKTLEELIYEKNSFLLILGKE
ncbi:MAG: M16 family metallopeptidase, partial [Caldimicrobium sp.]